MNSKLSAISPSFCFHPWTQIATNPNGELMNCCMQYSGSGYFFDRPGDIEAFWNSEQQKQIRMDLLAGNRPTVCSGCWRSEASGMQSKRQLELAYTPAAGIGEDQVMARVEQTATSQGHCTSAPTYLDLKPSNKCNLKCRMCAPENSHLLHTELLTHQKEFAPLKDYYVDGFNSPLRSSWTREISVDQLLPMSRSLKRLNISGGEPLLNPLVPQFIESLVKEGLAQNIHLTFNTNGLIQNPHLYGLFSHFKNVCVYISVDGIENIYEYIRFPAEWNVLDHNMDEFMKFSAPNVKMIVNPTLQLLNALSFDKIYEWAKSKGAHFNGIDHVTFPQFHSANILPSSARDLAIERIHKLIVNGAVESPEFPIESIIKFIKTENANKEQFQRDFVIHTNLLDELRHQDIRKSCPELFSYIETWFRKDFTSVNIGGAHG